MKRFQIRLFFLLSAGFILFTIIGTLSHEFGHYAAGKMLGHKASIHYGYTNFESNEQEEIGKIYLLRQTEIETEKDFSEKEKYDALIKTAANNQIKLLLGGPLQTMITRTLGLILILVYRRNFYLAATLNVRQWLLIFISLFWLRQVANFAATWAIYLYTGKSDFEGDEIRLANLLRWDFLSISLITGIIGLIVSCFVIFNFIPVTQRKTFIAAGFTGGITGFILWLYILGPIVLP